MIRRLLPGPGTADGGEELEEVYHHPAPHHLRLNFVASLDGAIEVDGRSGPLGGPADKQAFMAMRAVADVVLVASGTAVRERYGPVILDEPAQARRLGRQQSARPALAVVSGQGRLDPGARMFTGPDRVLVFTTSQVARARTDLGEVADLIDCGDGEVDLRRVVGGLRERGLGRILCEGGPFLARGLMRDGLVDEVCLTLSPLVAGVGRQTLAEIWVGPPVPLRLEAALEADGMLLTRYATEER
ncbi:MAG: dihydrofolate reductase family protein [Acidobacteriota bacterium]|nr:dihydrofolate reductase family protein [Acidobacteriota bacterium]